MRNRNLPERAFEIVNYFQLGWFCMSVLGGNGPINGQLADRALPIDRPRQIFRPGKPKIRSPFHAFASFLDFCSEQLQISDTWRETE